MNEQLIAALIAAGLTKGQAENYAKLVNVESEDKIPEIVESIKATIVTPDQGEIDRRVTQAVKTAVDNYEKKHNLKDGVKVEKVQPTTPTTPTPPDGGGSTHNPEFDELKNMLGELGSTVKSLVDKTQQEERQKSISIALKNAGIPETVHKRFSIKEDATQEEITAEIVSFKQELADIGVANLTEPGGGDSTSVLEKDAKRAASIRNGNSDEAPKGGVQPKKLI